MQKKALIAFSAFAVVILSWFLLKMFPQQVQINSWLNNQQPIDKKVQNMERSLFLKSEILENLSLHLDDVEFLHNAFIVQALVGPLVRFSNRGRYEPYVAKSWTQSDSSWVFHFNKGLSCEDGQPITPHTFKVSLARSLRKLSSEDLAQTPFRDLQGVQALVQKNDSSKLGIEATDSELKFSFDKPVGKALLEYLAMTPFAFLCESNFEGEQWRSRDRFASSGPYKVAHCDLSNSECILELRPEWPLSPAGAFHKVFISSKELNKPTTSRVDMTYGKSRSSEGRDGLVLEVPRALLSARLGIQNEQFFSNRGNRRVLQAKVDEVLYKANIPFENYHRADSFFFGQVSGHEVPSKPTAKVQNPSAPLKIRGLAKGTRPEVDFYQGILFDALQKLGWEYEIVSKPIGSTKEFFNFAYDIAFDRSHVDATLDPDFVRLLFKSKLGPRYQDPGDRVSKLVDDFDKGLFSYRDFLINFNSIISEEAAILPLFHRGFTWQFSSNINVRSISPLMSILRYEELGLKDDEKN